MSINQYLGTLECLLEERKNVRERVFLRLWNAISNDYSSDQITCKPNLISLYKAAVVMVWQLIECPQSSKSAVTSFRTFFDMDKFKNSVRFDVIIELNRLIRHVSTPYKFLE